MKSLLPLGTDLKLYGGYATTIFVAGWATGGLIFGAVGDRIGRARTLALTVLMYSDLHRSFGFLHRLAGFASLSFHNWPRCRGVFGLAVAS